MAKRITVRHSVGSALAPATRRQRMDRVEIDPVHSVVVQSCYGPLTREYVQVERYAPARATAGIASAIVWVQV